MISDSRLFVGVYPTGIVYADRSVEVAGDYKRAAFLAFATLALNVEAECPADLRAIIERDARTLQARRGQPFQVSASGQTVTLGHALATCACAA